ncbi:hypothetical protein GCU85_07785 [Cardiobacteriales bacterium ML27]|uniref:UPF0033 domain-containing protein n=2 Tax=Ostreibacterium oceani TaxID=2654998 RepID=A0A6N7EXF4_9GAMM|nr:hypothetical protein [Ostreibacterium oceani]
MPHAAETQTEPHCEPLCDGQATPFADETITEIVDARGLICPLPVLKTRLALSTMQSGQCVQVMATDATSQDDMPVFAELTGHTLRKKTTLHENGQAVFVYLFEAK